MSDSQSVLKGDYMCSESCIERIPTGNLASVCLIGGTLLVYAENMGVLSCCTHSVSCCTYIQTKAAEQYFPVVLIVVLY